MSINDRLNEIEKMLKKIEKLEDIMQFQEADELLLTLKNEHLNWMIQTIYELQQKLELAATHDKQALIKSNINLNKEIKELRKQHEEFLNSLIETIESQVVVNELPDRPEVSE